MLRLTKPRFTRYIPLVAAGIAATIFAVDCSDGSDPASDIARTSVATVAMSLAAPTLTVGQSSHATVVAKNVYGAVVTGQTIRWSSLNPAVAIVSSSGLVTAVAPGTTTIRAAIDATTADADLTVKPVPVASVSVSLASSPDTVGQTTQVTAVAKDSSGDALAGRAITWSSTDTTVATVSLSGVVTAVSPGTANIQATIENVVGSATMTVSASRVATLTVTLPAPALTVGQFTQAAVVAEDASGNVQTGQSVTWSSLNPGVATVSSTGLVTAVAAGQTAIQAAVGTMVGAATVSVSAPAVATVTVNLTSSSLAAGQTTQATAVAKDANGNVLTGRVVAWSSINPSVATVSNLGVVTAVGAGQTTIQAAVGSMVGAAIVSVSAPVATIATVTVNLNSPTLSPGQTTQAAAIAKDSSGNVLTGRTILWSSLNAAVATVSSTGLVTAMAVGTGTIRATVGTTTGDGALTVVSQAPPSGLAVTPPELPRAYVSTTYPTLTGTSINVPAGGDLQAALNAANPGDSIVLAPGATYSGNYVLPAKACTSYIVIRTGGSESNFPAAGQRMTPAYAPQLAKISTPNVSPAIDAKNGSCKWWISRVEITGTPQSATVNYNYGLVKFGESEATLSALPSDLVLDRVFLHGSALTWVQHGVTFNGVRNAIVDSWVSDFHWPGVETHGVAGWAGPGPFKIVNNYIEAASINILFGGAFPTIPGVVPADIEIRNNHLYKPLSYIGAGYAVKNLLEVKHGQRMLIEGNILENSWEDGQAGYAVNLQSGGDSAPNGTCQTADVTFRYNIVRNAPLGLMAAANPYQAAIPMARVAIENNLFQNIGPVGPNDDYARSIQLEDNLTNVRIAHNTMFRTSIGGASFLVDRGSTIPYASNVAIVDNLAGVNTTYGAVLSGVSQLNFWAGGTGWQFDHNVFWASNVAAPDPAAPAGNFWPTDQTAVGFASDWSLLPSSPYKGKASDGTDPGADIAGLLQRTANVP